MQSYAVVMIDSVTNVGEYLSFCKNLKTIKVGLDQQPINGRIFLLVSHLILI